MEMIMGPDSQGWLRCNRGGCPTLLPPQAVSPIAATSFAGLVARSLPRKVSASPVRLIWASLDSMSLPRFRGWTWRPLTRRSKWCWQECSQVISWMWPRPRPARHRVLRTPEGTGGNPTLNCPVHGWPASSTRFWIWFSRWNWWG